MSELNEQLNTILKEVVKELEEIKTDIEEGQIYTSRIKVGHLIETINKSIKEG